MQRICKHSDMQNTVLLWIKNRTCWYVGHLHMLSCTGVSDFSKWSSLFGPPCRTWYRSGAGDVFSTKTCSLPTAALDQHNIDDGGLLHCYSLGECCYMLSDMCMSAADNQRLVEWQVGSSWVCCILLLSYCMCRLKIIVHFCCGICLLCALHAAGSFIHSFLFV